MTSNALYLLIFLNLIQVANATHFAFGTMSWVRRGEPWELTVTVELALTTSFYDYVPEPNTETLDVGARLTFQPEGCDCPDCEWSEGRHSFTTVNYNELPPMDCVDKYSAEPLFTDVNVDLTVKQKWSDGNYFAGYFTTDIDLPDITQGTWSARSSRYWVYIYGFARLDTISNTVANSAGHGFGYQMNSIIDPAFKSSPVSTGFPRNYAAVGNPWTFIVPATSPDVLTMNYVLAPDLVDIGITNFLGDGPKEPTSSLLNGHPGATAMELESSVATTVDSFVITAEIRDFMDTHPDFEDGICGLNTGMVESTLGSDGNPVFIDLGLNCQSGEDNFNQWFNDDDTVNLYTEIELTFTREAGTDDFKCESSSFFPINGELFGNQGRTENFHFTMKFNTEFTYIGNQVFNFCGDDDVWVFINNQLVVDLGGVHGERCDDVDLDTLGLTVGNKYGFVMFFAERHTTASNYKATCNNLILTNICDNGEACETLFDNADGNAIEMDANDFYNTGVMTWTPTVVGLYAMQVHIIDSNGIICPYDFVIEVIDTAC